LPTIRDSTGYVDVINRLAMLLYEQNADSTAWYAHKAREIAIRIDYKGGIADATNNLGVTADVKGDMQTALHYYNDAYNEYGRLNDSSNMVQTLMNIAMVYSEDGRSAKAIENFERAFTIGDRLTHDSIVSLLIYNYLMQYPQRLNQKTAGASIDRAVNIATRYHDTRLLLAIEQLKANNLINGGQRDSGIADLQRTAGLAEDKGLFYMSLDILLELGDLYVQTDSARAVAYYRQALSITEDKKFNNYIQGISQKLLDFYSSRKDSVLASYYCRKVLHAVIEKQDNDRRQGFDYIDYAIKDQELTAEKQRSVYNAKLSWLACVLCAMAIAITFIIWRNAKLSKKTHVLLQRQYESLEAASASLETSNQQYARLLKVVAHDLRNPIGAINSATNMMIATGETSAGVVKMIDQASSGCLQLIGELLQTNFEIKEDSLHKEPVPVNDLLQRAILLMQFRAYDKDQSLVLESSSHPTACIDKEQMTRVIDNLLVNAIKFSPENATIRVVVTEGEKDITMAIHDEGIGIPAAIAKQVFDPFTAAKRKGTAGEQTHGLGLYICKQIVEAHGGQIWFESEEGKGSTFFVRLKK
jgi:signal transduction histidine kinase